MSFIDDIKAKAKADIKKIVLPETSDIRTLEAASAILAEGFAEVILVGDEGEINSRAKDKGLNVAKAEFINPASSPLLEEFIKLFVELRGAKGMDSTQAKDLLLNNPLYFGVALVRSGKADGMVAGAINATSDVLRAGLQIIGTAKDSKIVSSFFVMVVPNCDFGLNGTFVFADCGLVQNPSAEELAHIAISSAKSFEALTKATPYVGLLSHSTYGSAKHADVDKVIEARDIAKKLAPHIAIDGELQLDAAIVPSVGESKAKGSNVAGKANVLVFPDLDSGNIGYKLVQRLAKAEAYGPITQGMAAPINDLSRGCSAQDIVGVAALTALQAQGAK